MAMTRQTMTISLPAEMVYQVDEARKQEHRTRSELVREALRLYLGSDRVVSVYAPNERQRRALNRGRTAIRRGDYYSLDEFRAWLLGNSPQKARGQKLARRASSRSRAAAPRPRRNAD